MCHITIRRRETRSRIPRVHVQLTAHVPGLRANTFCHLLIGSASGKVEHTAILREPLAPSRGSRTPLDRRQTFLRRSRSAEPRRYQLRPKDPMNRAALHQLVLELFEGTPQLRNFLLLDPRVPNLLHDLPGVNVPATQFAVEALLALEVRGLIDVAFFELLLAERPTRCEAISKVAALCDVVVTPLPRASGRPDGSSVHSDDGHTVISFHRIHREEIVLDGHGIISRAAGSLTLKNGKDPGVQSITLISSIAHIQRLPSLGRGSREVSVSRSEVRRAGCNLVWGEFDICISAEGDTFWRIVIQNRQNTCHRKFHIVYTRGSDNHDAQGGLS